MWLWVWQSLLIFFNPYLGRVLRMFHALFDADEEFSFVYIVVQYIGLYSSPCVSCVSWLDTQVVFAAS